MSTVTKEMAPSITVTSTVMNRENELKMEIEKLQKDNLRLKGERDLMERRHGFAVLKKSEFESELMASKRKCHELNEKSMKYAQMLLTEERNKRAVILNFNEKVKVLKAEKLESEEKIAKVYDELKIAEEKYQMVEKEKSRMVAECCEKIRVLEGDKLKMEVQMVKLIEELEVKKKMVEEKNQVLLILAKDKSKISSESSEEINGLKREKHVMEEKLAKLMKELNDEKEITEEKEKSRVCTECSEKNIGLEKEKLKREENLVKLIEELKDEKKPHMILMSKKQKSISEKTLGIKGFDSRNVAEKVKKGVDNINRAPIMIDLTESDDDSPNKKCSSLENKKTEQVQRESYLINTCQKRKRSEGEEDDEISVCVQRTRSLLSSDDGTISGDRGKFPFIKLCDNDKAETEENNIASLNRLGSRDRDNKWICAGDMISAFRKDPQLCMNAVCALYRQLFSSRKSIKEGGFSDTDSSRIKAIAEYFINCDPENRLSLSVSEVQEKYPEVLEYCERLVIDHYKLLFKIYQNKVDPFF